MTTAEATVDYQAASLTISIKRLAEAAGVSDQVVKRFRKGDIPKGPASQKLKLYLLRKVIALNLPPQINEADLELKRQRAKDLERKNRIADGELLERAQVNAAIRRAASALRTHSELMRREIEGVCCPACREAAADAVTASTADLAAAVSKALGGES